MIWQEVNRCLRTLLHVHRLSEAVDICRRKWHLGSRIQSACHQSEQPTCCSHHSKPDSEPSYLHKKYGTSPPTLSEGPESASSSQPQASSSTYIRREPARIGSTDFLLVWCLSCYPNNGIKHRRKQKALTPTREYYPDHISSSIIRLVPDKRPLNGCRCCYQTRDGKGCCFL